MNQLVGIERMQRNLPQLTSIAQRWPALTFRGPAEDTQPERNCSRQKQQQKVQRSVDVLAGKELAAGGYRQQDRPQHEEQAGRDAAVEERAHRGDKYPDAAHQYDCDLQPGTSFDAGQSGHREVDKAGKSPKNSQRENSGSPKTAETKQLVGILHIFFWLSCTAAGDVPFSKP